MGLDMYAFTMKAKEAGDTQTMDGWSDDIERVEQLDPVVQAVL